MNGTMVKGETKRGEGVHLFALLSPAGARQRPISLGRSERETRTPGMRTGGEYNPS